MERMIIDIHRDSVNLNNNPQLRTYSANLLKEINYHTLQMNGSRRSRLAELKHLETVAKELMATLQKDFHLSK